MNLLSVARGTEIAVMENCRLISAEESSDSTKSHKGGYRVAKALLFYRNFQFHRTGLRIGQPVGRHLLTRCTDLE